jgi:hypothetical protein
VQHAAPQCLCVVCASEIGDAQTVLAPRSSVEYSRSPRLARAVWSTWSGIDPFENQTKGPPPVRERPRIFRVTFASLLTYGMCDGHIV